MVDIEGQITKILDNYTDEVARAADKTVKQVANEAAQKIATAAQNTKGLHDTGDYASGWTVKKGRGGYIVHNKKAPRLSHLLENGHIIKNQYGSYGRVPGIPHIKPVEEWAKSEVEKRIKEVL